MPIAGVFTDYKYKSLLNRYMYSNEVSYKID